MEGLGIDWRLLLIQILNFLILFFVLKKWVYPPFIKFLENRAKKIQESLAASEKMRSELKVFEAEKTQARQKLAEESERILNEIRHEANLEKEKIINEAQNKSQLLLDSARQQIENEKQKAVREAKQQTIDLSLTLTQKVVSSIDEAKAHQLISEALQEAEKQTI